ncbi:hypothetical protein [Methanoplanus endosymbiosus]|uniref:Uncharacterized protein n=1 Tax=Methanoplanus endosymbiosus TaxID=33865 RepID=A0A9E7PM11_9EURY|nr:hypothetical protein [Methanoplanus endosymbiosus]UUX92659.1 hypothetical protein L6E24_00590 [Methanoplanus endosymbiosus]
MYDSYGIFTTDGITVAGTLHDEYAVHLAERLDESTASLYISTKNGELLLGTAVNVQKKGRRPDTFIYLEKTGLRGGLLPGINLSYIHGFYTRVQDKLSQIDYVVRDLASDNDFFDNRHSTVITGLLGPDAADYTVGRLVLGKDTVCVSDNLSKSVDFVVAVAEKLHSYLPAGFTMVVSKMTFRGADLNVAEKYSGRVDIDLKKERTESSETGRLYRSMGTFVQSPVVRRKLSGITSRSELVGRIISEFKGSSKFPKDKSGIFDRFLADENIGVNGSPADFSSSAYEPQAKGEFKAPAESEYGKWKINDLDRESLNLEYEKHMEKKKGRIRLLAVIGILVILLGGLLFFFVINPGFSGAKPPVIVTITPSATITPEERTAIITRLSTPPGNVPEGLLGFGSAYDIMVSGPQNVVVNNTAEYNPDKSYRLMRYNESGLTWDYKGTPVLMSDNSAEVFIADSGIYRLFSDEVFGTDKKV